MLTKNVIVAGHICLDMTPDLSAIPEGQFNALLQPGRMIHTRGVTLGAGGAVSNTGLSLHKLGVPVRLIGKIGDDLFGQAVQDVLRGEAPELIEGLVVDPSTGTSFTIIINPPGFDRTFLNFPGSNDTFYASDIPRADLRQADLFHFGYPSLMRSIYRGDGGELVSILLRARREGLTTSLDFSLPDPVSPAGQVDWPLILANSLPLVDLFVPSVEELIFLLERETFDSLAGDPDRPLQDAVTPEMLHALSDAVLGYGVEAVLIKLGHRGVYLRTAGAETWKKSGRALADLGEAWFDRELWAPAFKVEIQGTTGAGDAAIAGFLSSILQGADPETALVMAAATGACSVGGREATGGLLTWEETLAKVRSGWETWPLQLAGEGWRKDEINGLWEKA